MGLSKLEVKEKARKAIELIAEESDEKFDDLLELIAGDHKPTVARSRVFALGVVVGIVVSFIIVLIL